MSNDSTRDDQTALTLAAIRWYAISIEKLANDIYITKRDKYPEIETILRHAFRELGEMRQSLSSVGVGEEGCPSGYQNCDGVCLPVCDPIVY